MKPSVSSWVAAILLGCLCLSWVSATPLDDYVKKPDSNYKWTDTGIVYQGQGWTGYVLNMTSQAWLTANDWYSQSGPGPLWWHFMLVVVPHKLRHDTSDHGLLWITGGSNSLLGVPKNDTIDALVTSSICVETGVIGAALFQVPNQGLYFRAEQPPVKRSEDAAIAYTWRHFIEHPDQPEWLMRLPMTKAAVRAMDTLNAFSAFKFGRNVNKFVVSGASKRGWTTWTTAAVDKRVVAIVPVVMDLLNVVESLHHHFRSYGGWSFALSDYYKMNFTGDLDSPAVAKMMSIVDPLVYADRLKMPKLVVSASGDEFFLPDDQRFWWDKMPEPKNLLVVQNAEHSMATGFLTLLPAVAAFVTGTISNHTTPMPLWQHDDDNGKITVTSVVAPSEVVMWHAFSMPGSGLRDFRLVGGYPSPNVQPLFWSKTVLTPTTVNGQATWTASAPAAPNGQWCAYFVAVKYPAPASIAGKAQAYGVTTSVGVTPNTYPFPDCHGASCLGKLV